METTPLTSSDPRARRAGEDGGMFAWIAALFSGGKSPTDAPADAAAGSDSPGGDSAGADGGGGDGGGGGD